MSIRRIQIAAVLTTLALAVSAPAQMPDPEKMIQGMQNMMSFAKDVRVDEDDVESILAHWEGFQPVADKIGVQMGPQGEGLDFESAVKHPEYVQWAKSNGLDPDTWARKLIRAGLLLQRDSMLAMGPQATQMMAQQKQMLEAQREAMGEAQYQMMSEQMSGWQTQMEKMAKLTEDFAPTEAEKEVLATHEDALMKMFGASGR